MFLPRLETRIEGLLLIQITVLNSRQILNSLCVKFADFDPRIMIINRIIFES